MKPWLCSCDDILEWYNNTEMIMGFVIDRVIPMKTYHPTCDTRKYLFYLYHTHINIWYTCNKTGKTQNTIRILK